MKDLVADLIDQAVAAAARHEAEREKQPEPRVAVQVEAIEQPAAVETSA